MEKQEGMVVVDFALSEAHALALAQFIKRVGWQEFRTNAAGRQRSARDQSGG